MHRSTDPRYLFYVRWETGEWSMGNATDTILVVWAKYLVKTGLYKRIRPS